MFRLKAVKIIINVTTVCIIQSTASHLQKTMSSRRIKPGTLWLQVAPGFTKTNKDEEYKIMSSVY